MRHKEAKEHRIVFGQDLVCTMCRHKRFFVRTAQLNTTLLTFLGLDWLNPNADCYVCESCGYVHWFMRK